MSKEVWSCDNVRLNYPILVKFQVIRFSGDLKFIIKLNVVFTLCNFRNGQIKINWKFKRTKTTLSDWIVRLVLFHCQFRAETVDSVDWYESQWWLNTTKNGSVKWKNGGRNRTKVYIYPSYGIDEPKTTTIRASTSAITTSTTSNSIASAINLTTTDDESSIILPGTFGQFQSCNIKWKSDIQLSIQLKCFIRFKSF